MRGVSDARADLHCWSWRGDDSKCRISRRLELNMRTGYRRQIGHDMLG